MTRGLEKRVQRLEGGTDPDEVVIMGNWPLGCSEERFRELASAKALEFGYDPPFSFQARCTSRPGGEDDITLTFIGTSAEFGHLLEKIQRSRRLITPLPAEDDATN